MRLLRTLTTDQTQGGGAPWDWSSGSPSATIEEALSEAATRREKDMDSLYRPSERESIIEDARGSDGKSPRERAAMFIDLLETVDVIWRNLTPEERRRRIKIARQLDPAPDPWWKNLRPEAQPQPCDSSSD